MLVGMHGNVTGNIVEDIRLRQIVQFVGAADGDRGRKFAIAQAVKKENEGI